MTSKVRILANYTRQRLIALGGNTDVLIEMSDGQYLSELADIQAAVGCTTVQAAKYMADYMADWRPDPYYQGPMD